MTELHLDRATAASLLGTDPGTVAAVQLLDGEKHTWRVTARGST